MAPKTSDDAGFTCILSDTKKPRSPMETGLFRTLSDQVENNHMLSIITWPKPEHETWVAPSSRRAKS
jgi:hypothetical protein